MKMCIRDRGAASEISDPQPAHAVQQAGWVQQGGRWWYAHEGGGYATGWEKVGGTWYYFDASGWMQTGWQHLGGSWYYLKPSGAMAEGWQQVGQSWYWLAPGDVYKRQIIGRIRTFPSTWRSAHVRAQRR